MDQNIMLCGKFGILRTKKKVIHINNIITKQKLHSHLPYNCVNWNYKNSLANWKQAYLEKKQKISIKFLH